jgi:DNA-binding NarL/FixJ family response regulator
MKCSSGTCRDPIRVLLADSNQTLSHLLSSALRRQPGLKVACCSSELLPCLEALRSTPADIVLLCDGASQHDELTITLRALHDSDPKTGIILLSDNYDRSLVVNATRAGARGLFCRASQPFCALRRCIAVVHQGQFWANTEQMGYIVDALNSNPTLPVLNAKGESLLTAREAEVVNLVAEGLGNRVIAQLLGIKENTVKKSLLRIYVKLGVPNRVGLVVSALAHRGMEIGGAVASKENSSPLVESKPDFSRELENLANCA